MSLAQLQNSFMAQVLDEDAALPHGWSTRETAGMAVYRNNYRSALVEALRSTFERTARWVGDDAFRQAAAHHLITHPPASWTLDEAGRGFDETCAELFANDPEVAELAWLEWTMLEIFTVPDAKPLDGGSFAEATARFAEDDWGTMRLSFLPGTTQRAVNHDLLALWNALGADDFERIESRFVAPRACLVWREGERPVFALIDATEGQALAAMDEGASYEDACAILAQEAASDNEVEQAAMLAGAMLGRWLNDGLIAAINPVTA